MLLCGGLLAAPAFCQTSQTASPATATPNGATSPAGTPYHGAASQNGNAAPASSGGTPQTGGGASAPAGSGAAPANRSGGNGNRRRGGARGGSAAGRSSSPAPAADSRIVITGMPASNSSGSADRPLLPIVGIGNAYGIPSGSQIQVRLEKAIDSGHAHNGDLVNGTLIAPLGSLPAGTPVRLTVVQAAPAGTIASYGELSIQVVSIADHRILSNTVTALGKKGAQELPDAAPARGTEAIFSPDQPVTLPVA